jgi:osmoprotectant transport system ATP-binding protein
LIGPSGCGKSTLLKLMNGLHLPETGEVWHGGERLGPQNVLSLRQRTGYVIQEGGLFPHLTARANVELLARHLGWNEPRRRERVTELAELARLPLDSIERYPAELSGGQRQRVGLMRALMLDPPVLLLDEPLGALDPMVRSELGEDLRSIVRTAAKTVVMVTHDMGEAVFFADSVVLLRAGRIVQAGSPRELVQSPANEFVEQFVRAQRSPLEELR